MQVLLLGDEFRSYRRGVYHCLRCHDVIRIPGALTAVEAWAVLVGHTALYCQKDRIHETLIAQQS